MLVFNGFKVHGDDRIVISLGPQGLKVLFVLQDQCFESGEAYSIEDILAYGDLKNFIENAPRERPVRFDAAFKVYQKTRLKNMISKIRKLRTFRGIEYELYFLTPFGLVYETEFIVPYKECLRKLSIGRIKYLLGEVNALQKLQFLLNMGDFDLFVLVLDRKLYQSLNIEEFMDESRKYIVILDSALVAKKGNVLILYPSKYYEQKLEKLFGKRFDDLVSAYIDVLARLLNLLQKGTLNFDYFTSKLAKPDDLFNLLKEFESIQTRIVEFKKIIGEVDVYSMPYEVVEVIEGKIKKQQIRINGLEAIVELLKNGYKVNLNIMTPRQLQSYVRELVASISQENLSLNVSIINAVPIFIIENHEIKEAFEPSQKIKVYLNGQKRTLCFWPACNYLELPQNHKIYCIVPESEVTTFTQYLSGNIENCEWTDAETMVKKLIKEKEV